jgi:hypothetical protein
MIQQNPCAYVFGKKIARICVTLSPASCLHEDSEIVLQKTPELPLTVNYPDESYEPRKAIRLELRKPRRTLSPLAATADRKIGYFINCQWCWMQLTVSDSYLS